jgi:hypothetical protein
MTYTAVPYLSAPNPGPPVILGPNPIKRGQPICLGTQEALSSSTWDVYNTGSQLVAHLAFGSETSQCLDSGPLACGVYYVVVKTTATSGTVLTSKIRISVVP